VAQVVGQRATAGVIADGRDGRRVHGGGGGVVLVGGVGVVCVS